MAVPVEIAAVRTGVGKHPVQDHPDTVFLGIPAKGLEILLGAQIGIDFLVIPGVVPVVGGGLKNRVQIKDRHAQIPQVGQFFPDPPQVPAEKVVGLIIGDVRLKQGPPVPVAVQAPLAGDVHRLPFPGPAEPVGKDLVHDAGIQALRHGKVPVVHRKLPFRQEIPDHRHGVLVPPHKKDAGFCQNFKPVKIKPLFCDRKYPFIYGKLVLYACRGHDELLVLRMPVQPELDTHLLGLSPGTHKKTQTNPLPLPDRAERRFAGQVPGVVVNIWLHCILLCRGLPRLVWIP